MKYIVIQMPEKERTLKALRGECWHEIVERGEFGGAICKNCEDGRSWNLFEWPWYCPKSPDHVCHYFSRFDHKGERYVGSVNGEKIIFEDYDGSYETSDQCIFCGQPEERK